jgi:type IV pilus modification protein PilV
VSGDVPLRVGRWTGQAGLTLVEFLFAISVIAFTGLGVAGMFPAALRSVASGGQVTKATVLAQSMADMIRNDPFDTLETRYNNLNTSTDTTLQALTCPVTPSGYDADSNKKKWKCDIAATTAQLSGRGLPSGYGTVFVACLNADGTTGTCGSTDLRRVTVTVTWDGAGSRSVSLVTYVARTE